MNDRDKRELAQVFCDVIQPMLDQLRREFVHAAVEILDQQASDFAKIMETQNGATIGKMMADKERIESERRREENRISDMMLEGLRIPASAAGSTEGDAAT